MRFGAHLFVWTAEAVPEGVARAAREAAEAGLDFLEIPSSGRTSPWRRSGRC